MTRRYFVKDLPPEGGLVTLSELESRHAIQVMRVRPGDRITLFDGVGNEANAEVREVNRKECRCESDAPRAIDNEPRIRLQLGIALPKPDRMQDLIERLTELGVASITPLTAARSQRPPSEKRLEKLNRYVVEACKQSGRNRLMHIHPPQHADSYLSGPFSTSCRLIAEPGGEPLSADVFHQHDEIVAAIGPEGGWTEQEVESAVRNGFTPLDLGPRIYRIETAATLIAAAAAIAE